LAQATLAQAVYFKPSCARCSTAADRTFAAMASDGAEEVAAESVASNAALDKLIDTSASARLMAAGHTIECADSGSVCSTSSRRRRGFFGKIDDLTNWMESVAKNMPVVSLAEESYRTISEKVNDLANQSVMAAQLVTERTLEAVSATNDAIRPSMVLIETAAKDVSETMEPTRQFIEEGTKTNFPTVLAVGENVFESMQSLALAAVPFEARSSGTAARVLAPASAAKCCAAAEFPSAGAVTEPSAPAPQAIGATSESITSLAQAPLGPPAEDEIADDTGDSAKQDTEEATASTTAEEDACSTQTCAATAS